TAIGLAFDRLVHQAVISLERLIELCATNPARILHLADCGTLRTGARADLTILDPELTWTFDAAQPKSKSRNTPFDAYTFRAAAVATIVGGRLVHLRPDSGRLKSHTVNAC